MDRINLSPDRKTKPEGPSAFVGFWTLFLCVVYVAFFCSTAASVACGFTMLHRAVFTSITKEEWRQLWPIFANNGWIIFVIALYPAGRFAHWNTRNFVNALNGMLRGAPLFHVIEEEVEA